MSGSLPVVQVARRQLGRRAQRLVGVGDAVELLVLLAQAREDLDRLVDARLVDLDRAGSAARAPGPSRCAAVLLERRRPDAAELAAGERGLEQVARRPSPPPAVAPAPMMVWISSMKRMAPSASAERLDDRLDPLLEVAAVARAGDHRAHVERVDDRAGERRRHLAALDLARQPLDDGRLADAGVADEERVVLAPPRQDVQRPLDLATPPDQRIDLAGARALVQVDRELGQRIGRRLVVVVVVVVAPVARQAGLAGRSLETPCEM